MRRWPTWLVAGALLALGSVAAADALRGQGREVVTSSKPLPRPAEMPARPSEAAMNGVLYYSDTADDCRLAGLSLPDLGNAPPPKLRSCRFSLSPDGETALPGKAEWSPGGGLYARGTREGIEVGRPSSRGRLRVAGSAPAFKPDGTFTYVRNGAVVEWTIDCPPHSRLFTLPADNATARCRRVLLSGAELRRGLPRDAGRGDISIKDLAWLSRTRLVLVVGVDARTTGSRELVVVFEGRRPVITLRARDVGLRLQASPRGSFFTAWNGTDLDTVRDRNGNRVVTLPLPSVHALAWSADERWTAVATRRSVFVFRTNEGEARVRRLPIVARDLAWR